MRQALAQARLAGEQDEVPVGAVIVTGRMIAAAHNQREQLQDPTAHAEMIAITQAAAPPGSWRLQDCLLYVTWNLARCVPAIVQARLPWVIYGATDPKAGAQSIRCINSERHAAESSRANSARHTGRGSRPPFLSDFFRRQRALGKK